MRRLVMTLASVVGVYALLVQVADAEGLPGALRAADWRWLLAATGLAAATNLGYVFAFVGSTTAAVPLGPALKVQVAGWFTNVLAPNGLATAALKARFLHQRGEPTAAGVTAQLINGAASVVVQLVLVLVAAAGATLSVIRLPVHHLALAGGSAVLGGIAVVAIGWRSPRWHRMIAERTREAVAGLRAVARSPSKLALLMVGQLLVQIGFAAALSATCLAFGWSLGFQKVVLTNIAASALAGLSPAPAGIGVAEATFSAALVTTGLPPSTSVAVALTYRLVTTWLPVLPGWFALHALDVSHDL